MAVFNPRNVAAEQSGSCFEVGLESFISWRTAHTRSPMIMLVSSNCVAFCVKRNYEPKSSWQPGSDSAFGRPPLTLPHRAVS
jgi:hypothetical protein